ncbi:hypothetical protein GCM10009654_62830 [Streptomyces hebeiensis]|uniref:Uncharacterized protein n=1 Tax=Streptomyces hebeiensis TaxID=229486 RepID=A0ABN1V6R2_9ACTN
MFGYEEWRNAVTRGMRWCCLRRFQTSGFVGVGIMPTGEEEVKVAKSEAPEMTGVWCNRE